LFFVFILASYASFDFLYSLSYIHYYFLDFFEQKKISTAPKYLNYLTKINLNIDSSDVLNSSNRSKKHPTASGGLSSTGTIYLQKPHHQLPAASTSYFHTNSPSSPTLNPTSCNRKSRKINSIRLTTILWENQKIISPWLLCSC